VASATPHEMTLGAAPLAHRFTAQTSARLIGDRAFDGDLLEAQLQEAGIEMIAPRRHNRVKPQIQGWCNRSGFHDLPGQSKLVAVDE